MKGMISMILIGALALTLSGCHAPVDAAATAPTRETTVPTAAEAQPGTSPAGIERPDPEDAAFVRVGMGVIGLIGVFAIGWTTNDNNAYTAGLALNTALYHFKQLTRRTTTIIVAVLAVLGACFGLGSLGFISFVATFQGSFNMSLVGVMIAHYFVVSRQATQQGKYLQTKGVAGIIAWLIPGFLTYFNLLPYAMITNAALAFVLYLVLFYALENRVWAPEMVDTVSPPKKFGSS